MPLTAKMRKFADEWLTGEHTGKQFNATAASIHAGYTRQESNPSSTGSKLMRHPEVKAYIQKQLDAYSMSATEVLLRFTDIARSTPGTVVTTRTLGDGSKALVLDPDEVIKYRHLIKNFTMDSNGNPKVEFHDPVDAMKQIARIRGMLKDGLELSGPGGGAVPVAMQVQFVDPDGSEVTPGRNAPEPTDPAEDFSELEDE